MTITLPMPPSANRYWRSCRGRVFVSAEAKAYKALAAQMARDAGMKPLVGDVVFTVKVYRPQKSGDLGNRLKVLEDALEGVAYLNDKQITEQHAYRFDDRSNPRVEVTIARALVG
jgi:crossover junction endodeoxyribonuclease RusA